jgi:hypothetical protein
MGDPKKSLGEILEKLCPGVRKRNWPSWAGEYKPEPYEQDYKAVPPKMTQDEDDD